MWKHGSCKEIIDTQYYWITDSITELLTVLLSNTEVVAKILKLSMVVLFLRRILLELSRNHWSCAKARKHWLFYWVILTEYCVSISLHEPCFHIQDTNEDEGICTIMDLGIFVWIGWCGSSVMSLGGMYHVWYYVNGSSRTFVVNEDGFTIHDCGFLVSRKRKLFLLSLSIERVFSF